VLCDGLTTKLLSCRSKPAMLTSDLDRMRR
jgi:hypothetical protein